MGAPKIAEIRKVVKAAHPDAKNLEVVWTRRPVRSYLKDGHATPCWFGTIQITADGFKPKSLIVSQTLGEAWSAR